jgi:transcriptional/translational regulatory protein YebC/TACO1
MAALEGGAEDITAQGGQWEVVCAPGDLQRVRAELEGSGVQIDSGDITYLPSTSIALDESLAPKVLRLVDALEDLDDVQAVFANFDIPDEILASLE